MAYIYCIENKYNKKKYVGKTICSFNVRISNHINLLNRGKHANLHLQRAWDKYGESNFDFYILEECYNSESDTKEIYWIERLNTIKNGYNITTGGGGTSGWKASNETKEKHRQSMLSMSDETRDKLSKSAMGNKNGQGIVFTEERKNKIREALLYKKKNNSSSKFHGVYFDTKRKEWRAYITINKKTMHIGWFKNEISATKAYNQYIIENNLQNPLNYF